MRRELAWLTNEGVRLVLLLAVLGLLVIYVLTVRTGFFGIGDGLATGPSGCSAEEAPAPASVNLTWLLTLRSRIDRTMAGFEPGIRPYEEGLVRPTSAWTDAEPIEGSRLPSEPWPAAYEMRWWLRNGDDVAIDIFVFTDPKKARDFSVAVRRPRCGSSTRAVSVASSPVGAHNLQWRNPLGLAQEDVYLQQGRRVYRVVIVKHDAERIIDGRSRLAAFAQIDDLMCRLGSCRKPAVLNRMSRFQHRRYARAT